MTTATLAAVEFHGHTHTLIEHAAQPYVAMRSVVEAIGLDWSGQLQRIRKHPVMGTSVVVTPTEVAVSGHVQRTEVVCLPLEMLNGWLFGVDTSRVKPALRETLIAYQRECFAVLHRHWHGLTAPPPSDELPTSMSHRADHVVAATRMFSGLMRAGQSLKLPRARLIQAVNAATLQASGYDVVQALEAQDLLAPPQDAAAQDGEWVRKVADYAAAKLHVTAEEVATRVLGAEPGDGSALIHAARLLKAAGYVMRRTRLAPRQHPRAVWSKPSRWEVH